jgi:hypothetical protein
MFLVFPRWINLAQCPSTPMIKSGVLNPSCGFA